MNRTTRTKSTSPTSPTSLPPRSVDRRSGGLGRGRRVATVVAVVLVLAAAVAIGWAAWSAGSLGQDPTTIASTPKESPSARPSAAVDGAATSTPPGVPLDASAPRTAAPESLAVPPPAADRLTGRVVDASGEGIADARVALGRRWGEGFWLLDRTAQAQRKNVAEERTDAAGEFAFDVPTGVPFDLHVRATGMADVVVPRCVGGRRYVVRLDAGAVVTGRVLLVAARGAVDGEPLPDAEVVLRTGTHADLRTVRSDAAGAFRFDGVRAGHVQLEVRTDAGQTPAPVRGVAATGGLLSLTLPVVRGDDLVGRVTDAASGAPIAGAVVAEGWDVDKSVRTDAEGRYRLRGVPAPGYPEVRAFADGYAPLSRNVDARLPTESGTRTLDFALTAAGSVTGHVVDGAGLPIVDAYVAAIGAADRARGVIGPHWTATRTDATGTYRIDGLGNRPYALLVRAEGYGRRSYDFPGPVEAGKVTTLPDVVLREAARIVGVVRGRDGRQLPEAKVRIEGTNADRGAWALPDASAGEPFVSVIVLDTDAEGRFACAELPSGRFVVRATPDGRNDLHVERSVDLESGELAVVDLVVDFGLSIRGRVALANGDPVNGATIVLFDATNGAELRRTMTSTDGDFELRGVEKGTHRLRAQPRPGIGMPIELDVAGGTTDLLVQIDASAIVDGTLLGPDGTPRNGHVEAFVASSTQTHTTPLATARTVANGRFTLDVPLGAIVDLRVRAFDPDTPLRPGDVVPLAEPDAFRALRAPARSLTLRLAQ